MSEATPFEAGFVAVLSPRVREKLLALAEPFRFAASAIIFGQGDRSQYLYIVRSGRVALDIHVPSKGRRPFQTVEAGEIFSWSALTPPFIETASARAVGDVAVIGIKGTILMETCQEDCEMGFEVYRTLAAVLSTRLLASRLQLLDVFAAA